MTPYPGAGPPTTATAPPDDPPEVWLVIPAFNAASSIVRCARSALRQTGVRTRVVIVDHGSTDATLARAREVAAGSADVRVVAMTRTPDEARSPARPLNVGLAEVLRASTAPRRRSWLFRLDSDDVLTADDVVAHQLAAGNYRALVMATLVFVDPAAASAYEYGPRRSHRTLRGLPGRDVYAVAHHANAVRLDLLEQVLETGDLYDPALETGEDLGATCRIIRTLGPREYDFAFVEAAYCYKEISPSTITVGLPLRRAWAAPRRLLRENAELSTFAIVRGFAELALARVAGEPFGRRLLQHVAGRNGHYQALPYWTVSARMRELDRDDGRAGTAAVGTARAVQYAAEER